MADPTPKGSTTGGGYLLWAQSASNAMGVPFIIGVRPLDRGWFASCAGVEYDGPPEAAVPAVVRELHRRAVSERQATKTAAEQALRRFEHLDGIASVLPREPADAD